MFTLIIFSSLCLIQFLFLWIKWNEIKEYAEFGEELAITARINNKNAYKKTVVIFGNVLRNFRKLLWIPVIIIMFINMVISLILGGILAIIF